MEAVKKHLKNTFTSYELARLRYLYLCIAYDGSKFLILLVFFSCFHLGGEFCMEILFLISLRNFFGGMHFNRYVSCFAFTFAFSSAGIALSHLVELNSQFQISLLVVIILISIVMKPVTSSNRPPLTARQERIYHCCGMFVLFVYFALFLTIQTFPYRNLCFWVIVLQTMQLIAARLMKGEQKS